MARKDPSLLPPLPRVEETRSFTDERTGDVFDFTFGVEQGFAAYLYGPELAQEHIARFVDGGEYVAAPGRPPVPISRTLCEVIAQFQQAEVPTDDQPCWSFAQWAIFSQRSPDVFAAICQWHTELVKQANPLPAPEEAGDEAAAPPADPALESAKND